jgi:hypothetical protein
MGNSDCRLGLPEGVLTWDQSVRKLIAELPDPGTTNDRSRFSRLEHCWTATTFPTDYRNGLPGLTPGQVMASAYRCARSRRRYPALSNRVESTLSAGPSTRGRAAPVSAHHEAVENRPAAGNALQFLQPADLRYLYRAGQEEDILGTEDVCLRLASLRRILPRVWSSPDATIKRSDPGCHSCM